MIEVVIPERELWDERNEVFLHTRPVRLKLEHSLLSISNWESKWKKSFLETLVKITNDELIDYIRCMSLNHDAADEDYLGIDQRDIRRVLDYINDPMTATKIRERRKGRGRKRIITSEVVYSWMAYYGIPFECQKWHFNRLMTLIRVCQANGAKPEKMGRQEAAEERAALNAARKKKLHSKG